MANITISQLPSASELSSQDIMDIVQQDGNRKVSLEKAAKFFNGQNIIVSNEAPPTTCNSEEVKNYNKTQIYVYNGQNIEELYILENIEEDQSISNTWNLIWKRFMSTSDLEEYITSAQLAAHNTSPQAHEDIRSIINVILNNVTIDSFSDIQKIVRQGVANQIFKVGEQFVIDESNDIIMTILGFDQDEPADPQYTHSMTIQTTAAIYPSVPFSSPQATWYIDSETYPGGLSEGTYNFYIASGIAEEYGGQKSYKFTLTQPVPVGGQICINIASLTIPFTNATISTYQSSNSSTDIEKNIRVSEGTDGTELPTLYESLVTNNTNSITRAIMGSNRWETSYARQWLNGTGSNWWIPQTVFDRRPDVLNPGYLLNFSGSDFLSIIGPVKKRTQKSISDGYGIDITEDTFFLLSRSEVYGGVERIQDGPEGAVYEYYGPGRSDLYSPGIGADSNRIKYVSNVARTHWLRTAVESNGEEVRTISTDGSISQVSANNRYVRFAPACAIW